MGAAQARAFVTDRYKTHAARTFGRRGDTTLRITGNEPVLEKATAMNLALIERHMSSADFAEFREEEAESPAAVWNKVVEMGLQNDPGARRIVTMSLGNPSPFEDYPPNEDVYACSRTIAEDPVLRRKSSGYTNSFGYPALRKKLKRTTMADPESIMRDPAKFDEVQVYVTTGSSYGSELVMAPWLLTPNDSVAVHDWIYISHLAAAYARGAHIDSYECLADGRPDVASLAELLKTQQHDRNIRVVTATTIGNPTGVMTREDVVQHLRTVEASMLERKQATLMLFDVAYEAFRMDGNPLDPIEIAIDEGIKVPVFVLDSVSKVLGLCGWRLGVAKGLWPNDVFPEERHDFFTALEYDILPRLGVVAKPEQMALNMFLKKCAEDPAVMARAKDFIRRRRELIHESLLYMANALRKIDGVYISPFYTHGGTEVDPKTLSAFYLMVGFTKLGIHGSGYNQVVPFGKFASESEGGIAIVDSVPSQSFLPEKRWKYHGAGTRVTGLPTRDDIDAFLTSAEAYATYLKGA